MKTKILELLKTKFPGVQDSVLNRIADKAARTITTEDAATTYVEGVVIQQVIESHADSRVTEATNTAVANYEKKHNLKDGKPVETPPVPPTPQPGDDAPQYVKDLIESNKQLQARLDRIDNGQTVTSRRDSITAKLKDIKVSDVFKNQTLKTLDKLQMNDEEFAAFELEIVENATALAQESSNNSLGSQHVPFVPVGTGQGKTGVETDIKSWVQAKTPANTPSK